jgi:hypothetical protein
VGDKITGRFWWGPITTEANAKNIINVVGWLFVGIGLLGFQVDHTVSEPVSPHL